LQLIVNNKDTKEHISHNLSANGMHMEKCCNMNFEHLVWVMTCSPCLLLIPFTRNFIHDLVLSELHCHRVDASKEKNVLALNSLKSCYQYV